MGYAVNGQWAAKEGARKLQERQDDLYYQGLPLIRARAADNQKKKKYPLIKSPSKIIPVTACYVSRKILQYVDGAIAPDPTSRLNRIVKRGLQGWGRGLGQKIESGLIEFSPLGAALLDFSEGASNLYSIYTVVEPTTNMETPIYFRKYSGDGFGRKREEALPANFDNALRENIRYVLREMESHYNDQELQDYYRNYFSEPGFDFVTNGDVPDRCVEPNRIKKWAVRDSSYVQHEVGANTEEHPQGSGIYVTSRMLNVDGTDYLVRRYEKASGWNKFIEWASFAGLWRITDWAMLFRPAKEAMMKLSPEFGQVAIEEQYKICSAIKRGFFYNAARNDYDFDLKRYMTGP
jgi:hypothetical protein